MAKIADRFKSVWSAYRTPFLIYIVSRIVVFATMVFIAIRDSSNIFCKVINTDQLCLLAKWDSGKYLLIADHGYGKVVDGIPPRTFAFFPAYPELLRALSFGTTRGSQIIGLLLSFLIGFLTTALIWKLFTSVLDEHRSKYAIVIFWFMPMTYAMSLMYAEVLAIPAAAAALLAVQRKKWLLAFVLASLAFVLKPQPGLVLPVVTGMIVIEAFQKKQWKYLIAVPVAALVAYIPFFWLDQIANYRGVWFETQRYWWRQDVGLALYPHNNSVDQLQVASMLILFTVSIAASIGTRIPKYWVVYVVLVFAAAVGLSRQFPRFRFYYIAFPAIAMLLVRIPRRYLIPLCGLLIVVGPLFTDSSLSRLIGTV